MVDEWTDVPEPGSVLDLLAHHGPPVGIRVLVAKTRADESVNGWVGLFRTRLVLLDNLGIHTPKGSLLLRHLLVELRGQLVLVYTPPYDPDANRIEWLWRALRRCVTHTHTRESLPPLLEGADTWVHTLSPTAILRQISSPFADADPAHDHELTHAAGKTGKHLGTRGAPPIWVGVDVAGVQQVLAGR